MSKEDYKKKIIDLRASLMREKEASLQWSYTSCKALFTAGKTT